MICRWEMKWEARAWHWQLWTVIYTTHTHCTWSVSSPHFTMYSVFITIIIRNSKLFISHAIMAQRKCHQRLTIHFEWGEGCVLVFKGCSNPIMFGNHRANCISILYLQISNHNHFEDVSVALVICFVSFHFADGILSIVTRGFDNGGPANHLHSTSFRT